MERCHYHTRGGCGGKNTGRAASPLKGPEFLLGWGKLKRHRCVKFSRRSAAASSAAATAEKVTATKEQAKLVSRRKSSISHRVLSGPAASSEKGGSSSGSEGAAWPRIEIALTSQEKEEDFMAFKGTKPSLRPKKRAKPIQKNVNLMSPGTWLSDLSLERYQVREKKTSRKKAKGLRAMGSKDSDSE